jgi:hypothetical protein
MLTVFRNVFLRYLRHFLMALHGVTLCIKDDASLLDFMHFEISFDCTKLVSLNLFQLLGPMFYNSEYFE